MQGCRLQIRYTIGPPTRRGAYHKRHTVPHQYHGAHYTGSPDPFFFLHLLCPAPSSTIRHRRSRGRRFKMRLSTEHIDSNSGRSPSDDVKEEELNLGDAEFLSDPDANLSPEERAAIVCSICPTPPYPSISRVEVADTLHLGSQTPLEARCSPNPLALPPLFNILLRPYQHRQCQT